MSDAEKQALADLGVLMEILSVEVAKDGGTIELVSADYRTGVVEVSLGGACSTCSLTGTTLDVGVERILKQRLDWVREVRGKVEESSGVTGFHNWRPVL